MLDTFHRPAISLLRLCFLRRIPTLSILPRCKRLLYFVQLLSSTKPALANNIFDVVGVVFDLRALAPSLGNHLPIFSCSFAIYMVGWGITRIYRSGRCAKRDAVKVIPRGDL